jgi:phosphonate transport system permease protein
MPRPLTIFAAYIVFVVWCFVSLIQSDDITLGRNPWRNFAKTVQELSAPSLLDIWAGSEHFEYKNSEGEVLRVENRKVEEENFFWALLRGISTTLKIATLGSFLGSVLAFPVGAVAARNVRAPLWVASGARTLLGCSRAVHTLIFGLLFVGIFGLGPTAGIMAIAAHCFGSFGKLYAESIETLDMASIDAVRAVGASEVQIFFNAVWPAILPQIVSTNLYIWEFNFRDSTVLGLIGAGGLGLLVSEATSLFQWARLSSILIAIILMVSVFDAISSRLRARLM